MNDNISNKLNRSFIKPNNSIILNISSDNIINCSYVAKKLQEMKILCTIRDNQLIKVKDGKYIIENGCEIRVNHIENNKIKKKLWMPLRGEFELEDANLFIPHKYNGSINNF